MSQDKPDQKTLVVNAIWGHNHKMYSFELIKWGSESYVNDPTRIARFLTELNDLSKYNLPGYRFISRPLTDAEKEERHLVRTKQAYGIVETNGRVTEQPKAAEITKQGQVPEKLIGAGCKPVAHSSPAGASPALPTDKQQTLFQEIA